ncbi:hypothetical protein EDD15DRAFT_2370461 [Pisolithus albus]|nr:hypothetical protein EDD15DRAFT_2370461 [Pisolithus albus]
MSPLPEVADILLFFRSDPPSAHTPSPEPGHSPSLPMFSLSEAADMPLFSSPILHMLALKPLHSPPSTPPLFSPLSRHDASPSMHTPIPTSAGYSSPVLIPGPDMTISQQSSEKTSKVYHLHLNGRPCDENGNFLSPDTLPPPRHPDTLPNDWYPYRDCVEYETAQFLYVKNEMVVGQIDTLCKLWAASMVPNGDVPWQSFEMEYDGPLPKGEDADVPPWMKQKNTTWWHDPHEVMLNMLKNPDFDGEVNLGPYCHAHASPWLPVNPPTPLGPIRSALTNYRPFPTMTATPIL